MGLVHGGVYAMGKGEGRIFVHENPVFQQYKGKIFTIQRMGEVAVETMPTGTDGTRQSARVPRCP